MPPQHILVIGAGAVGVSAAYYLHKDGYRVTLLDKGRVGAGCSHGNAGLIVPSHSIPLAAPGVAMQGLKWMFNPESPFFIKPRWDPELIGWLWRFWLASTEGQMRRGISLIRDLSLASLRLFEELEALEDVEFGLNTQGLFNVYMTEQGFENARHEAGMLASYGIETDILSPSEIRRRIPAVHPDVVGGVHFLQDAHVTPQRFVAELARYLGENGVDVRESTEVLGFDLNGGTIRTVKTTRGDMTPDQIVVATGAWSSGVGRMLDMHLPIQPAKGYSVTVKRPPDWPEIPMVLGEAWVGVTPMMETLRFAGTLELAGFDESINRRRVEAILRGVRAFLPGLGLDGLEVVEIWRGMRPCTPDGLPFLGRSRRYANLVVAAGHAMIGVSLGPITGRLVAQIVSGQKTDIDIGALRVERFE